jgi:hypothetical protein
MIDFDPEILADGALDIGVSAKNKPGRPKWLIPD